MVITFVYKTPVNAGTTVRMLRAVLSAASSVDPVVMT